MSAVTGPMMTGLRGAVRTPVIDLEGSISTVGLTMPLPSRPAEAIEAVLTLEPEPGPPLKKPPAMLLAMMMAEPASALLPRGLMIAVPCIEIWPRLTKLPPEETGQVKPAGALVSLAQVEMPPAS